MPINIIQTKVNVKPKIEIPIFYEFKKIDNNKIIYLIKIILIFLLTK